LFVFQPVPFNFESQVLPQPHTLLNSDVGDVRELFSTRNAFQIL
jgi:hypothetical protein